MSLLPTQVVGLHIYDRQSEVEQRRRGVTGYNHVRQGEKYQPVKQTVLMMRVQVYWKQRISVFSSGNFKVLHENGTSASARRISGKRAGEAVTSMRNTPPPFSRATSPSLIVCLYLAILALCTLLELTTASIMQMVYKKSRFSTNIWPITINIWTVHYRLWHACGSNYVDRPRAIHTCRPVTHQWISFITADVEKQHSKMQQVLLIMDSSGGATSNGHNRCPRGQKWSTQSHF